MTEEKLLVIDGFNLLSRGYFATSYGRDEDQLSRNSSGLYTNGLRVFFQKLFNLIEDYESSHLVIAWDVKREETDRRQKYDFYKDNRTDLPAPLIQQYETLTIALDELGISQLTLPPHEADDIIGSVTRKWSNEMKKDCIIHSNDKDFHQVLNQHTSQVFVQKKEERLYTIDHFREEYGIEPEQWIDVKSLLGDASDNVPGVKGVGQKSALPLIQMYQSVENIYQLLPDLDPKFNRYIKKLIEGEDSARISKELVTINCEIEFFDTFELTNLAYQPDNDLIREVLGQLELRIRLTE